MTNNRFQKGAAHETKNKMPAAGSTAHAASSNVGTGMPSGLPDFSTWEKRQISFVPYWKPTDGAWFYGRVVDRDTRDPKFNRYIIEALAPIDCFKGDKKHREAITVPAGEHFSMSVYVQLENEFDLYLMANADFDCPVYCKALEEIEGGEGTVWLYEVKVQPETNKQLKAFKANHRRIAAAQQKLIDRDRRGESFSRQESEQASA